MKKLGLDLGSSSLGWAILDIDESKIIKQGVITFDTGMLKTQGGYTSPTRDRRITRSGRNLIRARKYRKWSLLKILIKHDFVPLNEEELNDWSKYEKGKIRKFPSNTRFLKWLACDFSYQQNGKKYKNPYELRVKAIDEKLTKHELGRALYHLIQRRGYKDIGGQDDDTKKQLERRSKEGLDSAIKENRTLAEALQKDFLQKNKKARTQYPYRYEYENELEVICKQQGYSIDKDNKGNYQDGLVEKLWKAIIWQRPLRTQKGNIGKCTFEPSRQRCPISHPIFEVFRAWQYINTIKYFDQDDNKQPLPIEHKRELFDFLLKKDENFKFEEVKEFLDKKAGKDQKYNYISKEGKYDSSVSGMPICKELINLFGDKAKKAILSIEDEDENNSSKIVKSKIKRENKKEAEADYSIYDLWHFLFNFDKEFLETFAQNNLGIANELSKKGVESNPMVKIQEKMTQGYADLSVKAIRKILPFLKEGYLYDKAVLLAKIPDILGDRWIEHKSLILEILEQSYNTYIYRKQIIDITNKLIDKHKGLPCEDKFAYKDYSYTIDQYDETDIECCCENHFGEKSWPKVENRDEIKRDVKEQYQSYFADNKRAYKTIPSLTEVFKKLLNDNKIALNGELYHHSNRENIYNKKLDINYKTGEKRLPIRKNSQGIEIEILPIPLIDSIKNPMFNKAMSILRKLVNELILNGDIDQDTEIIIELARELNDNNRRIAIERYQKARRNERDKIRTFLEQYKTEENQHFNIEEKIPVFELWTEQIFDKPKENKHFNKAQEILSKEEKERYKLWLEQKGQCMYTGKMISITELFSNETDIEHTIPRSKLPDNTMANKTIAFKWYNEQIKRDKIPSECPNYLKDEEVGTAIIPRLDKWKELRDRYQKLYEDRKKAKGREDENAKNKRIQDKHYYKFYFDYWNDKVSRFEATEIKSGWVRRQLTDTQLTSKYAREFLKLYFKKVFVQKGSITSEFRKILGIQGQEEIKERGRHTHHTIDAFVLTLIPTNSSYKEDMLKKYYLWLKSKDNNILKELEKSKKVLLQGISIQKTIQTIENTTLAYNFHKDIILVQSNKIVRHRGKIQYVKNKSGQYILDKNGNRIIKRTKGDTVRSELFAQTYIGKIRDVERDEKGNPIRENGDWKYKTGKEEFVFVKREPINSVKSSEKNINSIVDPQIRKLVKEQKNNSVIRDSQNNIIRHVRIQTKAGREVKQRINYESKYDYKNKFYSEAGSIPYAILLQKIHKVKNIKNIIPIPSFEIAKIHKQKGKFDIESCIQTLHPNYKDNNWNKQLLKVGQKVLVLKDDSEYSQIENIDFITKRLYVIKQFKTDNRIVLEYHLNAIPEQDIDNAIKKYKDNLLLEYEKKYGIPKVVEDLSIKDEKERDKDYKNRKYSFNNLGDFRLSRLTNIIGREETLKVTHILGSYKKYSSTIEKDGDTPLLLMSRNNWNFLYEGIDFDTTITGNLNFKKANNL